MAGHARERWLVAVLAATGLVLAPAPASSASDEGVTGRSTGRGVDIEIERFAPGRTVPGQTAVAATRARAASGASCTLFPWIFPAGTAKGGIPPTPQSRRFLVSCDGQAVGTRWIGPADPLAGIATRAVDLAGIAERVLREIPVGDIAIGHRPQARAITGVPVYAWVDGYDGRPLARSVHELGATVDVRITLQSATWDFGDGTPPQAAGLGQPWPTRSDVQHTYEVTTPAGHPRAVTATLTLAAEYRVDGGPWLGLAPITRQAGTAIEVDEVQAVRNR